MSQEPCSECKGWMEQGVILISVDEKKSGGDMQNPWRTGGWCVVKDDAIKRMGMDPKLEEDTLKKRVAFIQDEAWNLLGLPREGTKT